ncbi:MAG: hypothetical protein AAGC74_08950 [Verrucomicrobiota bacterium]
MNTLRLLLCLPLLFIPTLTSCGGNDPAPPLTSRNLTVTLDSDNKSLFLSGTATTAGNFEDKIPFSLWFTLDSQPASARNDASRFLLDNHGQTITQRASYISENGNDGQIALLGGRLILRGEAEKDGLEFEGTWYFDGLPGGSFWIRPQ